MLQVPTEKLGPPQSASDTSTPSGRIILPGTRGFRRDATGTHQLLISSLHHLNIVMFLIFACGVLLRPHATINPSTHTYSLLAACALPCAGYCWWRSQIASNMQRAIGFVCCPASRFCRLFIWPSSCIALTRPLNCMCNKVGEWGKKWEKKEDSPPGCDLMTGLCSQLDDGPRCMPIAGDSLAGHEARRDAWGDFGDKLHMGCAGLCE